MMRRSPMTILCSTHLPRSTDIPLEDLRRISEEMARGAAYRLGCACSLAAWTPHIEDLTPIGQLIRNILDGLKRLIGR